MTQVLSQRGDRCPALDRKGRRWLVVSDLLLRIFQVHVLGVAGGSDCSPFRRVFWCGQGSRGRLFE
jgi:hypothetical protein